MAGNRNIICSTSHVLLWVSSQSWRTLSSWTMLLEYSFSVRISVDGWISTWNTAMKRSKLCAVLQWIIYKNNSHHQLCGPKEEEIRSEETFLCIPASVAVCLHCLALWRTCETNFTQEATHVTNLIKSDHKCKRLNLCMWKSLFTYFNNQGYLGSLKKDSW